MGRAFTFKYRVEFTTPSNTSKQTPAGWDTRQHGRANAASLRLYMEHMVASMAPGGVNHHIVTTFGQGAIPNAAKLIRQEDNVVVAEWSKS